MARSAGVSTTQRSEASRRGERHSAQTSSSLKLLHLAQRRTVCERAGERLREPLRARAVVLQEVVGHALRRARPDAGQHAQRLHQPLEALGGRDRLAAFFKTAA